MDVYVSVVRISLIFQVTQYYHITVVLPFFHLPSQISVYLW